MKPTRTKRQAVRRIRSRLEKAGLLQRAAALSDVLGSDDFKARLNAKVQGAVGDAIRNNHDVRAVVESILDGMAADRRDIALTFAWDPEARKLQMWARPAPALVQQMAAGAKLAPVK